MYPKYFGIKLLYISSHINLMSSCGHGVYFTVSANKQLLTCLMFNCNWIRILWKTIQGQDPGLF